MILGSAFGTLVNFFTPLTAEAIKKFDNPE
jgi:hypothetical protein